MQYLRITGVDKTLMDLERQWVRAALDGKGEALSPLLATNFVSIQSDGTMPTKAEYVALTSKGSGMAGQRGCQA